MERPAADATRVGDAIQKLPVVGADAVPRGPIRRPPMSRPGGLWGGCAAGAASTVEDRTPTVSANSTQSQSGSLVKYLDMNLPPGRLECSAPVCLYVVTRLGVGATPIHGREMGRRWEAAETSPALSLSWPADTLLAFTVAGEWRGKRPEPRPSPAGPRFTRTSQPLCGKRPAPAGGTDDPALAAPSPPAHRQARGAVPASTDYRTGGRGYCWLSLSVSLMN